ncbi:hypothetical protein EJB05_36731, partial [Eragrostis curvula]
MRFCPDRMARGAPLVCRRGRRCGPPLVYITRSDTQPKSGPSSSVTRGSTGGAEDDAAVAFLKLSSRIASMSSSISASATSAASSTHLRPCTGDTGGDSQSEASVDFGESESGEDSWSWSLGAAARSSAAACAKKQTRRRHDAPARHGRVR